MDALFEAAMTKLDPEAGLGVEDEEDFQVVEEDEPEDEEVEGERVNRDEQPLEPGSGDGGPER
ncbi:MAG: hypothetical protein JMN24_06200 [gamma proteobacterium endosymbiont of Lamellibrachia anaximandri]|nr:hypothetical protein [gamma proteobacterium endosymbiont of Lamellibrachia anaximandri]MBL3617720.1 hypothetical protein [gamma proteobacterium endosymbiont of Lamellibrachia anaximandri]